MQSADGVLHTRELFPGLLNPVLGSFGILSIDKPPGPTSHDVVGWVRWALGERSVGHCGTLDPPASGLLIVCVGTATKLADYLTGVDKRYRARFVLGRATTTADAEGRTTAHAPVPEGIDDAAIDCLRQLVGAHQQPPPSVSAVHLDGRRAHELARAGEAPELPPRPMAVLELDILDHGRTVDGLLWIDAELSVIKGTYIRSLAEELGRRLGLPAHLGALRRLACGAQRVDDPSVVGGLVGVELPEIVGRPPKWRIEPASVEADARAHAATLLRDHMRQPWGHLPFPTSELPDTGPHQALLARLLQGQRLRADGGTLDTLGLRHVEGTCAIVDRAGGHLLILAVDREHGRVAPNRALRFHPIPASDH
jgi:tRNA pseudouridine55 synthase